MSLFLKRNNFQEYAGYSSLSTEITPNMYLFVNALGFSLIASNIIIFQGSNFRDGYLIMLAVFCLWTGIPLLLTSLILYHGLNFVGLKKIATFCFYPFGKLFFDKLLIPYALQIDKNARIKIERDLNKLSPIISDFIIANFPSDGRFPFPAKDKFEFPNDSLAVFYTILKESGMEMPFEAFTDYASELALNYQQSLFSKLFLEKSNVNKSSSVAEAINEYINIFDEDLRYMPNFIFTVNENGILLDESEALVIYQSQISEKNLRFKQQKLLAQVKLGKIAQNITLQEIDQMEGHAFEKLLESLFKDMGYSVTPTKQVQDQGADLIVEKNGDRIVVQAKRYSENVGNKAVQEAHSAMAIYSCSRSMVVTNQFFTRQAKELAAANGTELWDRTILTEMIGKYPQRRFTFSAA